VIPFPRSDGLVVFVPVLGLARCGLAAGPGRHPYRASRPEDAESLGASVAGPQDGIVGTAAATIRLGTLPAWRMWEWRTSFGWADLVTRLILFGLVLALAGRLVATTRRTQRIVPIQA
jgi:hypothetical protein